MSLVSKRSRYALHGLAYIAVFADDQAVPFDEVLAYLRSYSGRLTLSPGYIAKIFQQVSRAGLTEAVPGPHGGYRLARPAAEIPLIEILETLDGPSMTGCCLLSAGSCPQQEVCGVRDVIAEAEAGFHHFFAQETLASLASRMRFPSRETLEGFGLQAERISRPLSSS